MCMARSTGGCSMEIRTNIVLDEDLVQRAMKKAGVATKKAAIEAALHAFLREPDWDFILSMEGSDAVAKDYQPGALFSGDPDLAWAAAEPLAAYDAGRKRATHKPASRAAAKKRRK
ncbi:MAG: type II toxin-antitoxin system VapB family antitoxin [Aquabacterium sp.]|nr:MAG: type II toxin-antitoxin system VapB family antitoxin [Aquabacterium sp.]